MFSNCPLASIMRRQIASPAQSPGSAKLFRPYRAFYIRLIAVAFQHQVGDTPDIDLRDHARQIIGRTSMYGYLVHLRPISFTPQLRAPVKRRNPGKLHTAV